MADVHTRPTLNMSAVVRATGVQPDTLRAWERRYGLPQPGRSEGGHRLYSRRDLEIVRWLIDRQEEGLRISQAVELWQTLVDEGSDPLHMSRYARGETPLADVDVGPAMAISQLKDAWLAACLAYDEPHGDNILAQAFAIYPPEAVCTHLLIPALTEIGEGWYRNELSVQQEHFASELAVRRLEALLTAAPPPTRSGRIMVACPSHERHRFPPLMLTYLLRRAGWETLYMGEDVPMEHLEAMLVSTHPALIVLAAQTLPAAADLLDMAQLLRERGKRVAYGGLIFNRVPSLRKHIPGVFLGDHLERVPHYVEEVLAMPATSGDYIPTSDESRDSARLFDLHRAAIDSATRDALGPDGIRSQHLRQAKLSLGDSLYACLKLGSLDPLRADMDWLTGMMGYFDVDRRGLGQFLTAYARAARSQLPAEAEIACRWLDELAGKENAT